MKMEYTNGEIIVVWQPKVCQHSGNCVRNLQSVFNNKRVPWVDMNAATTDEIISAVNKCPSGALSIKQNQKTVDKMENKPANEMQKIVMAENGPYLLEGKFVFVNHEGIETIKEGKVALCRCGNSGNKPFCDGTHRRNEWKA